MALGLLGAGMLAVKSFRRSPRLRRLWTLVRPSVASVEEASGAAAQASAAKAAAAEGRAFSEVELDTAVESLRGLAGPAAAGVNWPKLRELLATWAHGSHKDWARTETAARSFSQLLPGPQDLAFRTIFERALRDGGWDVAAAAASERPAGAKPWVVLATGVNGIRKTTSVYQPWFRSALEEALGDAAPPSDTADELPVGNNSFFRQLDYIIATAANEEFRKLYELEDVPVYANVKESIFARYRTVAEIWGAVFVEEVKRRRMNIMVETSGRDPAMFKYIDHFFSDVDFNKLLVHFTINDLGFAEASVDARMQREMRTGREALEAGSAAMDIVNANAGGPYGPQALRRVQAESQQVWDTIRQNLGGAGATLAGSWRKARIAINAASDADWTAQAVTAEGAPCGELYTFVPP